MVKVKNDLQQLIILYVCCCAYNVYYLCKMHQNTLFAALRFCRKFNLFLWKSTKTVAIRADPFGPDMHQIVCRLQGASSHTPHGELTAPPDPLAGLGGGPRGRERKKGRERERKRGEGNRKGEEARWWEGKLDTPDFQMDWRLCFIVFCQWWHNVPWENASVNMSSENVSTHGDVAQVVTRIFTSWYFRRLHLTACYIWIT